MAVTWTQEQQRVIDTKNSNILVSAAAGSGKTAVLVARILRIVTDEQNPVDIDRLLIVTFTNAAAAEMRERIRDALEKRAQEEPDNIHLQRQLVLVHNARITTIHSFCLNVLRSHFQTANIDPSFRIADEGEILLLEQDAVKETVDRAYEIYSEEEEAQEFASFVEAFASGKTDRVIEELVLQLYHFSLGQPWPDQWLKKCREMYQRDCAGESQIDWLSFLAEDTGKLLDDLYETAQQAYRIAGEEDGPYPYQKALLSDLEMLERLRSGTDYASYAELFRTMGSFARLGTKKDERIDPEKKELVQSLRAQVKDGLGAVRENYYYASQEQLMQEFYESGTCIRVLTRLTEAFMECLAQKKKEKNVVDFGDLEHLALQVLADQESGKPTAAAQEYAELFAEIMTDEYQDSNLVQELILNSVSGRGCGAPNRFMVGDVKQSIYRFRLARPELFMEKYRTYRSTLPAADQTDGRTEEERNCRIDLHRNFRSRPQVLESVNVLFERIMTEKPGGIVYDADAALYPGAVFEPRIESAQGLSADAQEKNETDAFLRTEVLLLEADGEARQRLEAQRIGQRILTLVEQETVWDKTLGAYRPARFQDIVILLRTVSGWAETFAEVLGDMGIPCYTGSQKGYFSAVEIRTVLSYLQILDNPMQDIPLAAVLHSPIGGFDEEDLARIRIFSKETLFFDCCQQYRIDGPDEPLRLRLEQFFETFESLRAKCSHTPMHLLLWELLDVTGYGDYAASLPAGEQRRANLDMLVEKAIAYEATSYRGLYHFVRYIENLKKYEVDYGEANIDSEAADTVRIMSIHKSKGLEFPIVFVSGTGKTFNEMDLRSRVIMHPDFGIACDHVDLERRVRSATLLKRMIRQKTKMENLGEEMRVLYVALTRAKEKLILTGSTADREKALEKWKMYVPKEGEALTYSCLTGASSYLDWIMPCLLGRPEQDELFSLQIEEEAETQNRKTAEDQMRRTHLQKLLHLSKEACCDEQTAAYLDRVFRLEYPYERDRVIPGKMSVSELKKLSHIPEEESVLELYQPEDVVPLAPRFRMDENVQSLTGAARGTVYHAFMEFFDFSRTNDLQMQLEELISCGKMTQEEGKALNLQDVQRFLETGTGQEMIRAAKCGKLFREQPFVLGVAADTIREDWNPEETVLVQGIIDAYYIDDANRIVILDYKTDRVRTTEMLAEKYRAQLDYYAMALGRLTGYEVRDRVIYSFCLHEELFL